MAFPPASKKAGKANIVWKINKLELAPVSDEQVARLVDMVKEKATELKDALSDEQFRELYDSVT